MFPPVTDALMVAPDDAAQHMEGGVRAHEPMPPLPVELRGHLRVDRRQLVVGVDRVPDVVVALLRADDPPIAARVAAQQALVGGLATAAGIEDRPVEEDGVRVAIGVDHGGLDGSCVGIGVAEVLAHAAKASASPEGSFRLAGSLVMACLTGAKWR